MPAEDLRHQMPGVSGGDFDIAVHTDAQAIAQDVALGRFTRGEAPGNHPQPAGRRQCVAVLHRPQDRVVIAECVADIGEAVDLTCGRLASPPATGAK